MTDHLSARNPRVQQLRRLSGRRSARAETGRFVIEGPKLLADALAAGIVVEEVFVEAGSEGLAAPAAAAGIPVHTVADGVIAQVSSTVAPQPCLATACSPVVGLDALPAAGLVVVLVGVNDPGNAGTVLRSAEAGGAAGVALLGESVDPLNPKVVRASAGSLFRLPMAVGRDAAAGLDALRSSGRRLIGTSAHDGQPHDGGTLRGDVALVLGSETHGLPTELGDRLDATVTIAMAGEVESLNLAMAATVLVFEARRGARN